MNNINKATTLLFLLTLIVTSCNNFASQPAVSSTNAVETAKSLIEIAVIETQTAMPTSLSTQIPFPTSSPLPPTKTSIPILQSPIPASGTPTTVVMENGLMWTECVLPSKDYAIPVADTEFATNCLKMDLPRRDDNDKKIAGERLYNGIGVNFHQVIGNDIYETRYTQTDKRDYELLKNGEVIARISATPYTFDPNRDLWNIGGRLVWEVAYPFVIIVDGINQNDKYQLEASHFPYEVQNKLIYIAEKNGKFSIIYDDKVVGPEFDEIYRAYCCGTTKVRYGQGQYWFWGRREGTYYVVAIH